METLAKHSLSSTFSVLLYVSQQRIALAAYQFGRDERLDTGDELGRITGVDCGARVGKQAEFVADGNARAPLTQIKGEEAARQWR